MSAFPVSRLRVGRSFERQWPDPDVSPLHDEWLPDSDVPLYMDRLRAVGLANPVDVHGDESRLLHPVLLIVDQIWTGRSPRSAWTTRVQRTAAGSTGSSGKIRTLMLDHRSNRQIGMPPVRLSPTTPTPNRMI